MNIIGRWYCLVRGNGEKTCIHHCDGTSEVSVLNHGKSSHIAQDCETSCLMAQTPITHFRKYQENLGEERCSVMSSFGCGALLDLLHERIELEERPWLDVYL